MESREANEETYRTLSSLKCGKKGGFRACSFIYVLTGLDSMGFVANAISLVLYFGYVMHFDSSNSANTLTNFMGSTCLLTLVGGFVSDTYLSRYATCLLFGSLEVLGLAMITIEARFKKLQPDICGQTSCMKGGVALYFYVSLCLLALGNGGARGALPAMGAEQFNREDPVEAKAIATFFNWLMLSTTIGAAIGVTGIVWVSMNKAWYRGFFICAVASFAGYVVLAIGKPFYRQQVHGDSPLLRVAQVIVLAVKNRKLPLPKNASELYEINDEDSATLEDRIAHTDQFRSLDKAAIIPKESKPEPGKVCTVTQVEEVKVLTRMLPILASTVIMNTCLAQLQTFSVQQGAYMEPHLGKIKVPTPSIPVIPLVFMSILLPMYEFLFVPFARKFTGHPTGITQLQRVGVGLVLSAISMTIAGFVEVKRRNAFNQIPPKQISLFWLSWQYGIFGIADMFTLVGLMEFFYREAPAGMRSLSTSFTFLSLSFGYFLSTIFVNLINAITKRVTPSKQGWLYGKDLNKNNLNLFYWFLAILSILNFALYLYAASWYKYKKDDSIELKSTDKTSGETPLIETAKENSRNDISKVTEPTNAFDNNNKENASGTSPLVEATKESSQNATDSNNTEKFAEKTVAAE